MARTYQPSTATQPDTATQPNTATQPDTTAMPLETNSSGSYDQRGENSQGGDNTQRRENLTAVRAQPDNDRNDSRENRDSHENLNRREDRGGHEFGESREERTPRDGDAFAPVLEAWKQVFKAWSELTETMVKAQRDVFASMIGAANATAKDIKNIKVGDHRDDELAFSGARTTASTPDRIEQDRR